MPEKPEKSFESYEDKVQKTYADLGKDGSEIDKWGTIKYRGEAINLYSDPEFIANSFTKRLTEWLEENRDKLEKSPVILDIGGGDGSLLNQVLTQLAEAGFNDVKGVDLDANPAGKSFVELKKRVESGEYKSKIEAIQGDFLENPLARNSVDLAISRMAIQYLSEADQKTFLKNINETLKKGGLFILEYPSAVGPKQMFNEIWEKITEAIAGPSSRFKRSFPTFMEFHQKGIAKECGLDVRLGQVMATWPMSAKSFADRFKISAGEIQEIFDEYSKKYPNLFETVDRELCLKSNVTRYIFEKPWLGI